MSDVSRLNDLRALRAFVFDMDGVIYRGNRVLPGAADFVKALQRANVPYLFVTNNSTTPPDQVAARLEGMGIAASPSDVLTSAQATAEAMRSELGSGRVLVVGELGIRQALEQAGFNLTDDHRAADAVVAGMDRHCTYHSLSRAALAIRRGIPFYATNGDRSFPSEEGLVPGAGSIVGLLEIATDVPARVIGKPAVEIFDQALRHLGVEPAVTGGIGDRVDTDVIGTQRAGMRSIAVLTGVGTREEFLTMERPPDWIFADLVDLQAAYFG